MMPLTANANLMALRFRRLAARKGKMRAIVAVAHTILVSLYHMLKNKQPYHELGAEFLDRPHTEASEAVSSETLGTPGAAGYSSECGGHRYLACLSPYFRGRAAFTAPGVAGRKFGGHRP